MCLPFSLGGLSFKISVFDEEFILKLLYKGKEESEVSPFASFDLSISILLGEESESSDKVSEVSSFGEGTSSLMTSGGLGWEFVDFGNEFEGDEMGGLKSTN